MGPSSVSVFRDQEITIEEQLELAKRAFALKKYEEAVDHYATALEQMYVPPRLLLIARPLTLNAHAA